MRACARIPSTLRVDLIQSLRLVLSKLHIFWKSWSAKWSLSDQIKLRLARAHIRIALAVLCSSDGDAGVVRLRSHRNEGGK